jgi:uncharacterized membrane protein YphA (DoxX/SURF4 family)
MANAKVGAAHVESTSGESGRQGRLVFYWVTTILAAAAFVVPGLGNLARAPHIAQDMAHLGYPPYFLTVLGTWKVLGAIAVLAPRFPRLKEWAYAGMLFDLTGAAASRAVMGDGATMVIVPLVIAGVVLTSWSLRPAGRRLDSPKPDRAGGEHEADRR